MRSNLSAPSKHPASTMMHIADEKADGTEGGTFTSGSWQTRDLNTVIRNTIAGASLAANQVTLPAGEYYFEGWAACYRVGKHRTKLYDVTGVADIAKGSNAFAHNGNYGAGNSSVRGYAVFAVESVIELLHICETTVTGAGFGRNQGDSSMAEVYSNLMIWKVK